MWSHYSFILTGDCSQHFKIYGLVGFIKSLRKESLYALEKSVSDDVFEGTPAMLNLRITVEIFQVTGKFNRFQF